MKIVTDFILGGSKITVDGDSSHEIKRCLLLGRKAMTKLHNILKSRHHFANKGPYSQSYGFSSSHVQIWELDHKEGWAPKNGFFWTVMLKKTLESPSDNKEIKLVNPKGKQPWIFFGRTDAETSILWPPDAKSQLIRKDPDAGKDWRQEKGMTEHEMVGWHHWLNGHEFEQALGDGKGQGSLAWCSPWGHKELDMTATELIDWYVCLAVLNISCGMWDLALWLGIKPRSPALRARSLTTGPPGKSWVWFLARKFSASMID